MWVCRKACGWWWHLVGCSWAGKPHSLSGEGQGGWGQNGTSGFWHHLASEEKDRKEKALHFGWETQEVIICLRLLVSLTLSCYFSPSLFFFLGACHGEPSKSFDVHRPWWRAQLLPRFWKWDSEFIHASQAQTCFKENLSIFNRMLIHHTCTVCAITATIHSTWFPVLRNIWMNSFINISVVSSNSPNLFEIFHWR